MVMDAVARRYFQKTQKHHFHRRHFSALRLYTSSRNMHRRVGRGRLCCSHAAIRRQRTQTDFRFVTPAHRRRKK